MFERIRYRQGEDYKPPKMTTCEPCEGIQIENALSVFGIRDSSTDDSSTDDGDDCANCHACILHRILDNVPAAMSATCCALHLTAPIEDQIELVKLMPNVDDHKMILMKARAQLKLIPRRFSKLQQLRSENRSAIETMVASTARAAIEGVLSAARARDAAAKRTANGKKKREKKKAQKRASAKAEAVKPAAEALDDFGPDALYCVVCLENVKNVLHTGCGHVATCSTCAEQLDACPLCRAPVTTRHVLIKVRVF